MRELRLIESSSSRAGRQFPPVLERDLHQFIDVVTRGLPGPPGEAWVIPEMPSPLGLPDFVVLIGGESWFRARSAINIAPVLAEADCVTLAALHPQRSLSRAAVARRLGWEGVRLDPIVDRLIRSGMIQEASTGTLRQTPGIEPSGRLMAVETKIKDWRRAVRQGRSYRTWSDNYVVILGEVGPVALARAQGEVTSDGGGLYADGRWLARPVKRQAVDARRLLGFEHLFAALSHVHPSEAMNSSRP